MPFCEEKKFVNLKNLAKIMNKGEKKNLKKVEEQEHFIISFLDRTLQSCLHMSK